MSGIRLAGGFTYLPKEYLDTPKIYFQQKVIFNQLFDNHKYISNSNSIILF